MNNRKILKALFISFSDSGTPYDFDQKVFVNAREALTAYRKFKQITKYKLMVWKVWAIPVFYHHNYTWSGRGVNEKFDPNKFRPIFGLGEV